MGSISQCDLRISLSMYTSELLTMCLLMTFSSCDGTITIIGSCADRDNGEKIEVSGSNRSSISCFVTEDCNIPSKFSGPFVGKPENFDVDHIFVNRTIGSVPVAVFTWNPATSGNSVKDLQGFQLLIMPARGNFNSDKTCRIFDLKNNTFEPGDHTLEFKVTLPGLKTGPDNDHYASLSALPAEKGGQNYAKELFHLPAIKTRESEWTSEISHEIQNSDKMFNVIINFTLAPTTFGFTTYRLWLYDRDKYLGECRVEPLKPVLCDDIENKDFHNIVPENATSATVTIVNVTKDQYELDTFRILILWKPCYDEQSGRKEEVRCKKKTEKSFTVPKYQGSTTALDALQTTTPKGTPLRAHHQESSQDFHALQTTTPKGTPLRAHHQESSQDFPIWQVVTIISCIVGVATLGAFLICAKWKKSKSDVSLRKRTVYILSAIDHQRHVAAVEKFAIFLEKYCHCVIYYQDWFAEEIRRHGVFQWIASHIDKADYTVVINSEAAFKISRATNNDMKYTAAHHSAKGDSISFALSHVRAKMFNADFFERVIMAYFSYTDESFLLPFNPGLKYKIPEDIPKLLCHIHKLEYDVADASIKRYPWMGQTKRSTEGREVLEAVAKASRYQLKVPDWFSKIYMIQNNAPIPNASIEGDQAPVDSVSKVVAFDEAELKCPGQQIVPRPASVRTSTNMTDGISLPPSKIATYDQEEFGCQITSPETASCFLPSESTYTINTEELNQLERNCLESFNQRSNGVSDKDKAIQHLVQLRQTKEESCLDLESESEALVQRRDECCNNVSSDFFIPPDSIADSDTCTIDVEHQLLSLNMMSSHL